MTGLEYEYLVAQYLRENGYSNVEVTQGSGDYGVDVIAYKDGHKYAVQCKYYSSHVSLDAVQEVVAGMAYWGCDMAMVVTNSSYTQSAIDLARCNGVKLLEYINSSSINRATSYPPGEAKKKVWSVIFTVLKWQFFAIDLFVALAVSSTAFAPEKNIPFGTALINGITSFLFITFPIWVYLIIRFLIKKFKPQAKFVDLQIFKWLLIIVDLILAFATALVSFEDNKIYNFF